MGIVLIFQTVSLGSSVNRNGLIFGKGLGLRNYTPQDMVFLRYISEYALGLLLRQALGCFVALGCPRIRGIRQRPSDCSDFGG